MDADAGIGSSPRASAGTSSGRSRRVLQRPRRRGRGRPVPRKRRCARSWPASAARPPSERAAALSPRPSSQVQTVPRHSLIGVLTNVQIPSKIAISLAIFLCWRGTASSVDFCANFCVIVSQVCMPPAYSFPSFNCIVMALQQRMLPQLEQRKVMPQQSRGRAPSMAHRQQQPHARAAAKRPRRHPRAVSSLPSHSWQVSSGVPRVASSSAQLLQSLTPPHHPPTIQQNRRPCATPSR